MVPFKLDIDIDGFLVNPLLHLLVILLIDLLIVLLLDCLDIYLGRY